MKGLLNWTGSLLFFLMFLTVMDNLLPGKKYNRYIRLFAGMVLVLLVAEPIAGGLNLEERMAYYFESFNFQQDVRDLSREILGIEEQRLEQVIANYEQAVEKDLDAMAEDMGYVPVWTQVTIEKDRTSRAYGTVVHIEMKVEPQGRQEEERDRAVQAVSPVEPVAVSLQDREEGRPGAEPGPPAGESGPGRGQPAGESGPGRGQPASESGSGLGQPTDEPGSGREGVVSQPMVPAAGQGRAAEQSRSEEQPDPKVSGAKASQSEPAAGQLNQLRRKVERYYGLETGEVEIQVQGR